MSINIFHLAFDFVLWIPVKYTLKQVPVGAVTLWSVFIQLVRENLRRETNKRSQECFSPHQNHFVYYSVKFTSFELVWLCLNWWHAPCMRHKIFANKNLWHSIDLKRMSLCHCQWPPLHTALTYLPIIPQRLIFFCSRCTKCLPSLFPANIFLCLFFFIRNIYCLHSLYLVMKMYIDTSASSYVMEIYNIYSWCDYFSSYTTEAFEI